jgi:hypothetical protein
MEEFLDKYSPSIPINTTSSLSLLSKSSKKISAENYYKSNGSSTIQSSVFNEYTIRLEISMNIKESFLNKNGKIETINTYKTLSCSKFMSSSTDMFVGNRINIKDDVESNTIKCDSNNWYIGLVSNILHKSIECVFTLIMIINFGI